MPRTEEEVFSQTRITLSVYEDEVQASCHLRIKKTKLPFQVSFLSAVYETGTHLISRIDSYLQNKKVSRYILHLSHPELNEFRRNWRSETFLTHALLRYISDDQAPDNISNKFEVTITAKFENQNPPHRINSYFIQRTAH